MRQASETRIIIAGFGGQGIVLVGNLIARGALIEGKNVTGMVAYGAEMRGGTAYATVVVSDEEIACPFVERPDTAIVLNRPSLDKFEPAVLPGGLILVNTSLVKRDLNRTDVSAIFVAATEIAQELGNLKVANLAALGAFIQHTGLLQAESVQQAVEDLFSSKNPKLLPLNLAALKAGMEQSRFAEAAGFVRR
jgi:2-oxoglutarate ferredoxin oxidoreductase subunit gamma